MATSYFFLKVLRKKFQKNHHNIEIEIKNNKNESLHQCRICLKTGFVPIFGPSDDLSEAVKYFGNIDLDVNDNYPKKMCNTCYSLLQGAILFRKSAKESEAILQQKPLCANPIIEPELYDITYDNIEFDESSTVKCGSFKCKLCKLEFETHKKYLAHKSSKQHRNVRIQCPICYGLLTAQSYKKHLARHESASHLICDVCGKLYRKDNLGRHMQLHSFDLPYQCKRCPYRGRFMESLKIHMRTHTGDKPFSCDKCQLRFLTRSNLNRHLLTHKKDRPHKCMECGRGFYSQRDMTIHFKADHAGIKDYGCRFCGNKYGTRKALMRHELRVHKRDKLAKGRMPLYLQDEYRQ